jgi:tetratricopeptide (TPR) repeat protein
VALPCRLLLGGALAALAAAAPAPTAAPVCEDGYCRLQMTAPELLRASEQMVLAGRYEEARPLVAALEHAPELAMERQFLEGYIAVETGDLENATKKFRQVLALRPDMTRARLELARTLMMQGKDKAADYHFSLAEDDDSLPPEIARTIYAARGLIRERRTWDLNLNFGIAPDTNINNATNDRTVDVLLGNTMLPLELDPDARARTGIGQTASVSGSVRLRLSDGLAMVVDADGHAINYEGRAADDISSLVAAGPELTLANGTRLTFAATTSQRWYGGDIATRNYGARAGVQHHLGDGARVAAQFDLRRVDSKINSAYDGTQISGYLSFEKVVRRSMVASVTGFARREPLKSDAYSNTEFGLIAGLGGELPFGVNAGVTGQASRATYDEALPIFGPDARKDWRLSARAYLGARSLRVYGFSPSVSYTYSTTLSNIGLYDFKRHRVEFQLARYF